MHCTNCGQETETGKFCTNCGTPLANEETAAATDSTASDTQQPVSQQDSTDQEQTNETVGKIKAAGANFGHFFMTLLKSPSAAKKANSNDLISAIITIVLFSLLIALAVYFMIQSVSGYFMDASFLEHFLVPLLSFAVMFGVVATLTFAGFKLSKLESSFTEVLAKYGAYLVPFMTLLVVGAILALIKLPTLPGAILLISILGPILLAPTFIFFDQKEGSVDRIFVIFGVSVVSLVVFYLVVGSLIESVLGAMFGGLFGGFGF
ncbi:hypothetical protein ACFSTA_10590 [Ornithinibacillus salinisoli]|uniref:Zinc ribbon domain-containing protein n=1 Tax=Ornithinibacillus salinisoli TaxID=1848459 RepID=A0ABW4W0F2_9BACI